MTDQERQRQLAARFVEAVEKHGKNDEHLVRKGRTLNAACMVHIGPTAFLLTIVAGVVVECTHKIPLLPTSDFTIKGSEEAWHALWESYPRAGWHDLFALIKRGEMSLEGDMQKVMAHLQFIKDLLSLPRRLA